MAGGRSKPWEPYLGGNPGNPTLAPLPGQGLEPYLGGNPGNPTVAPLPGQGLEPYQSRGL